MDSRCVLVSIPTLWVRQSWALSVLWGLGQTYCDEAAKITSTPYRVVARLFESLLHFVCSWCLAHVLAILLEVMAQIVEDGMDQVFGLVCSQQKETKQHLIGGLFTPSDSLGR